MFSQVGHSTQPPLLSELPAEEDGEAGSDGFAVAIVAGSVERGGGVRASLVFAMAGGASSPVPHSHGLQYPHVHVPASHPVSSFPRPSHDVDQTFLHLSGAGGVGVETFEHRAAGTFRRVVVVWRVSAFLRVATARCVAAAWCAT